MQEKDARVLDPETVTFLEGGCALIVGTVGASGEPHAARGWGLTVRPGDPVEMHLVIDADDAVTIENLAANARIAITGADVETLRSTQVKGTASVLPIGTIDERARAERFADAFFSDIARVDGTPRELLQQLVPHNFRACRVQATELYDQTPGPGAGTPLGEDAPGDGTTVEDGS
jgi:hypothetical protein